MTEQTVKHVVVLVGPPGAGKSTVGRLTADRLGVTFRDVDDDIVARTGKPIVDIFIDEGEEQFRTVERQAVAAALQEHEGVLSLGGGAVLSSETRELLKHHTVVLLDVDLGNAVKRVGLNRDRPVLALNPRAQLSVLLKQRMPLYEQVADIRIDTSGRTPDDVVTQLVQQLQALSREPRDRGVRHDG